jgi:hypothetical protein
MDSSRREPGKITSRAAGREFMAPGIKRLGKFERAEFPMPQGKSVIE